MKRYVFILALLFVSCASSSHLSNPLVFLAGKDYKYVYRIIIGSDTQAVNKTYDKYYNSLIVNGFLVSGNRTFVDSLFVERILRKYYITKDLENSINSYMLKKFNKEIICEGIGGYKAYYCEFNFNDKDNEYAQFCIDKLELAKIYFKDLKIIIENSNNNINQNKLLLSDLNALIHAKEFHISENQKKIMLRNAKTPKEKENMQKIINEIEPSDNLDQQKIQDN